MRLISLLILVAIVGGGAYVYFFTDLFKKAGEEAGKRIQELKGYGPAKSPREAMEKFLKSAQERQYKYAATYASKDYADKLLKLHDGARALGTAIDNVKSYLDDKQFGSDKTTQLLFMLDPFPAAYLKIGDVKEVKGKKDDKGKHVGIFVFTPPMPAYRPNELSGLDPKFVGLNALGAPTVFNQGVHEIKSEGEGEAMVWKIDFIVPQPIHEAMEYFNSHYKSYVAGLDTFRGELRQDRFLKDKIAPELMDVMGKSK
jgi:hypothetical protein